MQKPKQSVDVTESWYGLVRTEIINGEVHLIAKDKEVWDVIEEIKEEYNEP